MAVGHSMPRTETCLAVEGPAAVRSTAGVWQPAIKNCTSTASESREREGISGMPRRRGPSGRALDGGGLAACGQKLHIDRERISGEGGGFSGVGAVRAWW